MTADALHQMPPSPDAPLRIILFRTDKIGDLIVSTPVIAAIKVEHPTAKLMVVASPYNAPMVHGHPLVDEVILYDKRMNRFKKYGTLQKIQQFGATHTLVLSPKIDCYLLACLSGATQRGGLIMAYRWSPRLLAPLLLTHRVLIPRNRTGDHQAEVLLSLARKMGLAAADAHPPYSLPHDAAAVQGANALLTARGITGRFVLVHLADKWLEDWTPQDVATFLTQASTRLNLPLIATAGPADVKLSTALGDTLPLFAGLSPAVWQAFFAQASLVISPDCGAVHIACAFRKPLLALYPASRFDIATREFGPWQTHHHARALSPDAAAQIPALLDDLAEMKPSGLENAPSPTTSGLAT